jgi:hypothetical protein
MEDFQMRIKCFTAGLLVILLGGLSGCPKKSSDPCERLYDKMSRCKEFVVHESMEETRKTSFLKDCRQNFQAKGLLNKCLALERCAHLMVQCRNSRGQPKGEDVRNLFDDAAKQLGGK